MRCCSLSAAVSAALALAMTLTAGALTGGAAADAAVTLERLVIVGRVEPGAAWSDAATEATLAQAPELAVIALGRDGKRSVVVADADLLPLRLGGKPVADARRLPWAAAGADPTVEWLLVEPRGFRSEPAANGATSDYYSNVSTEPASFGKWIGYDRIEYFETQLTGPVASDTLDDAGRPRGPAARRILAARPGTDERTPLATKQELGTERLGTLRYRVRLTWDGGKVLATPGAEATDSYGILPSVHRVSIRKGDDFLGYLGAFLLVPEVFGSAGGGAQHQTERWVGADCADVMVGALRRSGRRDVPYTNVASLPQYATLVDGPVLLDADGRPPTPLTHGKPGDLIRIDYGGALVGHTPRAWDHVAAWWEDRSDPAGPHRGAADGLLDGFDLVIHMGHPRLVIEPLSAQSPATIDVLRWKPSRRAAR